MEALITQLFFDNRSFYRYVDKVRRAGIDVPISAGVMPITKSSQIKRTVELSSASMTKYQRLKDKKNPDNKEKMNELGDKIADSLEENKWMKLDWKEIKRSKGSLEEGIERVDKKITDRKRKLRQHGVGEMEATGLIEDETTPDRPTRDWSQEQGEAELDKIYYSWAYGEMQVVKLEDDYMYLMLLDKKGCKHVLNFIARRKGFPANRQIVVVGAFEIYPAEIHFAVSNGAFTCESFSLRENESVLGNDRLSAENEIRCRFCAAGAGVNIRAPAASAFRLDHISAVIGFADRFVAG